MSQLEDMLNIAKQRALAKNLPYAGELTPQEAFEIIQREKPVVLVDVRSKAELDLVGHIPNVAHIEWAFYPGMVPNTEFATQLKKQIGLDKSIIFMCRTGGRSHNAAVMANELGYKAYNMLEGFEGAANEQKQRTLMNGWKHAGLPWTN